MNDINCAGCGTALGRTNGQLIYRVYCNDLCQILPAIGEHEARDAFITALVETDRAMRTQLVEPFGVSRQRISQIIDDRSTA